MRVPFALTALLSTSALAHATTQPAVNDGSALVTSTISAANVTFHDGVLTWDGPLGSDSPYSSQETFSVNFGLLLEDDAKQLHKRNSPPAAGLKTRDGLRIEAELGLNRRGEITGLEKHLNRNAKRGKKGGKKGKGKKNTKKPQVKLANKPGSSSIITWYTGHDLLDPYCADGSGWAPNDNSMIAAVTLDWGPNRPPCGSFWQLRAPGVNKAIVVRVVDMCAGCAPGSSHFDLSLKAFKHLYPISKGKVWDIQASPMNGPPGGNWNTALYGPRNL